MSVIQKTTMGEDSRTGSEFADLLNDVDDPEFDKKLTRSKSNRLKSLLNFLKNYKVPSKEEAEQLLKLCVDDDRSGLAYGIAVMSTLLKNEQLIDTLDMDILVSSAVFLLDLLNTVLLTTIKLRSLAIQTILTFPDKVLIKIVESHVTELLQAFENNLKTASDNEDKWSEKMEVCHLLKILTRLPPAQAEAFLDQGDTTWLLTVIPTIISYMALINIDEAKKIIYLEYLELLTDALLPTVYLLKPHWSKFVESVCDSQKYPLIMMTLLNEDSAIWHRIWIVIIKLLQTDITKNFSEWGIPINSLLPVVETAFRKPAMQRVRAFECWNKLIDNFAQDADLYSTAKRVKLLMIPLKLNNAKTEDLALAKFKAWWHLICSFDYRDERFCPDVVIPFLHFMFGMPRLGPFDSYFSNRLKRKALEAFVEIVGHTDNCECAVQIPNLEYKILTRAYLLVETSFNDWLHSLRNAFKLAGNPAIYETSAKNNLKCTWTTMVLLIAELPDNAVRRDIFTALLKCILSLLQEPQVTYHVQDVVANAVMSSLFDGSPKMLELLKSNAEKDKPLSIITSAFTNTSMTNYYKRFTEAQLIHLFKPMAKLVLEDAVQEENSFFKCLAPNDITLKFWTATVDNLSELRTEISQEMLHDLMEWPLKSLKAFKEVKTPGQTWYSVYNVNHKKLHTTGFDEEVSRYILPNVESMNYFTVCVTIGVLKQRILNQQSPGFMPKLLENFTSSIEEYKEFKEIIPLAVDTIVVMLNHVAEKIDIQLANTSLACAKKLISVIITAIEKQGKDNNTTDNLFALLANLKGAINPLLKENAYNDSILELVEELSSHLTKIQKESPLFKCLVTHMKIYKSLTKSNDIIEKINKATESKEKTNINNNQNNNSISEPVREFTSPDIKKVKKNKKTEVNIVNKVVENGEEYVVVKSNWKFNPKKLTENQKEKLQRKREDIPALYQDLSQSQDEMKLATWKTDSHDTSTSTSTSNTNSKTIQPGPNNEAKIITILKNLPNADVVPKIMENILQEGDKKLEILQVNKVQSSPEVKKVINNILTPIVKLTKSPRMALKDRVFRNMKNLLEKSTPKDKMEIDPDHTENIPKTPPSIPKNDTNVANSAPPMLAADRPSRMKRRPKKFDDTELFALKKRRHSVQCNGQTDSQSDEPITEMIESDVIKDQSKQKTVENDSNKIDEQEVFKDSAKVEPSVAVFETKKPKKDSPSEIPDIANEVVVEALIQSSNDNNAEPLVTISEIEPVKDAVIETIVISESKAFTESKDVPDAVVKNFSVPDTKPECDIIDNPIDQSAIETVKKIPATPTHPIRVTSGPKSSTKKSTKKSRIEKELAIDMVEGHPFLKLQTEQRLTRKKLIETELSSKRKSVAEKFNKFKSEANPKSIKKTREKKTSPSTQTSKTVLETQEASQSPENDLLDEPICSEDVIESSQDSSITTISIKKTKRQPIVTIEKINLGIYIETQNLLHDSDIVLEPNKTVAEEKDDTILPQNQTVEVEKSQSQLTENMDTEPIGEKDISDDVIIIDDDEETPITINSEPNIGPETQEIAEADTQPNNNGHETRKVTETDTQPSNIGHENQKETKTDTQPYNIGLETQKVTETDAQPNKIGLETQEIAEADTQPNNSVDFMEFESSDAKEATTPININKDKTQDITKDTDQTSPEITINENKPLQADSITEAEKHDDLSSPFKDSVQRKKDFLNNTLEISPIKIQSPDRDKKSPSPETSSDYVVIKLSSPVHSNGEPFEKHGSPEFFTDEKISPDKRDISPPRVEVSAVNNISPSSSLSLKKNKPQVRPGGRAAHMLGLCVPEKLNTIKVTDRSEPEEVKKAGTPARRNLRVPYNIVSDTSESNENEESANFLKFKKSLPAVDSSPVGPILKRKLCDITDDTSTSPASKRKRVSFHDPPVSTTMSVHKYIEPIGLRSPQNSTQKRLERQTRQSQYSKSPKRLDNVFKLDTVLYKTVESFADSDQPTPLTDVTPEDTQTSLEVTPAMEIVKTSDLNDTDPICPKLVNCNDPIIVIAGELSSPSLKHLFVKQVEDKVKTVGDLAKMTEVDVCRLCIKAPKVKVAKKVLSDYAARIEKDIPTIEFVKETVIAEPSPVLEMEVVETNTSSIEIQTEEVSHSDMEVQTTVEPVATGSTQTDELSVSHIDVQTDESGSKTTGDIIATCLNERNDFIEKLSVMLEESSLKTIAEKLSTDTVFDVLITKENTTGIFDKILARESLEASGDRRNIQKCMSFMLDYMTKNFQSKDLILFCSQLLQKLHDRTS